MYVPGGGVGHDRYTVGRAAHCGVVRTHDVQLSPQDDQLLRRLLRVAQHVLRPLVALLL